jgi:hypothetical protein
MTISVVQSIGTLNGTNNVTFSSNITVGNTVFIIVGEYDASTTETVTNVKVGSTAVSSTTLIFPQINVAQPQGFAIVMVPNIQVSGQNVVSYTYSGTSQIAAWGCEVSGLGVNPTMNQHASATGATSALASGSTPASTVANAFVLGGGATYNGTSATPTGTTWTATDLGINSHLSTGWLIQTTSGGTYAWNQATGGTEGWAAGVVVVGATTTSTGAIGFRPGINGSATVTASGTTSTGALSYRPGIHAVAQETNRSTGALAFRPGISGLASVAPRITSTGAISFRPGISGSASSISGDSSFGAVTFRPGISGHATVTIPSITSTGAITFKPGLTGNGDNGATQSTFGIYQWTGTEWQAYQWGTGIIANNAITEPLLAAGIVVAGIIDGTTVNAATFNGSTFNGSEWIQNSNGSFYYNGTPAAGNLSASISPFIGDDGFGNYVLPGFTNYINQGGGGYVAANIVAGTQTYYYGANMVSVTNPWNELGNITAFNGSPNIMQIAPGPNLGDYIGMAGPVKVSGGWHYSGPITAYEPGSGSPGTDETWHTASPVITGWSFNVCRYRYRSDDTVDIQVGATIASTAVSGTATLFTLPAGYHPIINYKGTAPGIFVTGTIADGMLDTRFQVTTAGVVEFLGFPGGTGPGLTEINGYWTVPLD